jgi:hypothetical protein
MVLFGVTKIAQRTVTYLIPIIFLPAASEAPPQLNECTSKRFAELVVNDVQGFIDREPADLVEEFRAHEKICTYCQWLRQRIGERIGPKEETV